VAAPIEQAQAHAKLADMSTNTALILGLESADVETVDTAYVPSRFAEIKATKKLFLGQGLPSGKGKEIDFDYDTEFVWEWGKKLPMHSNGMRFMVFDDRGDMLATNDLFSVGGGFVVNGALSTAASQREPSISMDKESDPPISGHPKDLGENLFYKEIRRSDAAGDRRSGIEVKPKDDAKLLEQGQAEGGAVVVSSGGDAQPVVGKEDDTTSSNTQPRYPFRDATSLLALCHKHNLTIAQLVYENEKSHGYTDEDIYTKVMRIWEVMDQSILEGVQAPHDSTLPGRLNLHRRAPALYNRLTRGLYPASAHKTSASEAPEPPQLTGTTNATSLFPAASTTQFKVAKVTKRGPPRIHGSFSHPVMPSPLRRTEFPAMDYLAVYAIAVNETNAAGGRIVTAPTNGAAGIIPAVLKYTVEFISDDPERDIMTFLLTSAAIGMLYKRGATISAAEGGCMAEVGVACSMAAGAFAACMGASPETIEQAAEIGIEHNLGLTCDPIGGLVQAPCIERNALGAIKAISSANLALSSSGTAKVRLDDAIRAMRLTAQGMRNEFKETSLSGLATSVPFNIPVSVPDC
jgi:L-serine deaminase